MKIRILFATAMLLALGAIANHLPSGRIVWSLTQYDFGTLERNVPATAQFEFVNEGDASLVITSVKASCGCTVADYTKGEIAPGQSGKVSATYNAATPGSFQKTVTVYTDNGEQPITLVLKGVVQ